MMRRFGTTYPKILSRTAGEAGKESGLNTWVAMATVTLGHCQRRRLLEKLNEGGGNGGRHIRKSERGRTEKRG